MAEKPLIGIFDWSGVISDDMIAVHNSTNSILKSYNKSTLSEEELRETLTLDFISFWKNHNLDYHKDKLQEKFKKYYREEGKKTKIFPFAKQAIKDISYKLNKMGICSSHETEFLEKELKQYGLTNFHFVGGSVRNKSKYLSDFMSNVNIPSNKVFFVGDMEQDIIAGKKAGLITYGVLSGYHSEEKLRSQNPDKVFKDISELADSLQNIY